jgi:hypothetical protein
MSIVEALVSAEENGVIAKYTIKELPESCCDQSEIKVYDLDGYVRSLRMNSPSKSCDGVWVGNSKNIERVFLLEMKSISNMKIEFHRTRAVEKRAVVPGKTVEQYPLEYRDFIKGKLSSMELGGKFEQSNELLERLYEGLSDELDSGSVKETAILLCGLSLSKFISLRHIFNSAMNEIVSPRWGKVQAIPCINLTKESDLEALM